MKIVFLGTNGWYDTATGNTLSILVETERRYIVLDAGNGIYKLDQYITKNKPVLLFLSHFHLDHIIGLHIVDKFYFPKGMKIYYPYGMKKYLESVVRKPFTAPMKRLKTKIDFVELGKKTKLPISCRYLKLNHPVTCLGYRFEIDGKIVSFCTDTGYCKNMVTLSQGADLLISECAYLPGETHSNWPHLNPETAAKIAKDANVKRLALVHFDASRYLTMASRKTAEKRSRSIYTNTFAAKDGQIIMI